MSVEEKPDGGGESEGNEYKRGDVGVHNPKDLLAEKEFSTAGAGIIDAANQLDKAVDDGNKVGIGLGSVGITLETLGLVLDPIGGLLTAGIGWLIEHVTILRWPLDILHGDPFGIKHAEDAINAEKKNLEEWSGKHQTQLDDLMKGWSGAAADEFRKHMDAVAEQLNVLGKTIEFAAKQMKIAGGIIGAMRGIIRDILAMFIAMLVKGALIAVSLAPISFGASIATFIATTIGGVVTVLGKVSAQFSKLASTLSNSLKNMGNVNKATDDFNKAVGAGGKQGDKTGPKAEPGNSAPPPPKKDDGAAPGGKADNSPKPGSGGKPPLLDKATHDFVKSKLDDALENAKIVGMTPLKKEEILKKFDNAGNFPKGYLEKMTGEKWARRIEATVKTLTDPLFGGRGAVGKTNVEIVKGTGPTGDESEQ